MARLLMVKSPVNAEFVPDGFPSPALRVPNHTVPAPVRRDCAFNARASNLDVQSIRLCLVVLEVVDEARLFIDEHLQLSPSHTSSIDIIYTFGTRGGRSVAKGPIVSTPNTIPQWTTSPSGRSSGSGGRFARTGLRT